MEEEYIVMEGAEEIKNTNVNSKYQDKTKAQRLENFLRSMSMGFST